MKHLALALTFLLPTAVDADQDFAAKNLVYDSIECSIFFTIAAAGLSKPGGLGDQQKYRDLAATYRQLSGMLTVYGTIVSQGINMKPETFRLISDQTFNDQQALMGGTFSNFALLQNKYSTKCKAFAEAVDKIINEQ